VQLPGCGDDRRTGSRHCPTHGASARTLRAFVKSYHDLQGAIRDLVLPDPDIRIA
jgi:hypothetical protein